MTIGWVSYLPTIERSRDTEAGEWCREGEFLAARVRKSDKKLPGMGDYGCHCIFARLAIETAEAGHSMTVNGGQQAQE